MSTILSISDGLRAARRLAGLKQDDLASRAGLSRMTVQRIEAESIDPRLSTVLVVARALGLELMLVPKDLRPLLEDFVRSGGRIVGQAPGGDAPPSIVDSLAGSPRRTDRSDGGT